uniref:Nucleoporin NDC1 n=1 Tax=Panagrellus redivivus TaxID=6233 RepID=A0A7E4WCQ4_PANRE
MEPSFGGYHSTADFSRDSNYHTPNRAYPSSPATSSFNQSGPLRQRPTFNGSVAAKPVPTPPGSGQKLKSWFYDIVNKRQLNVLKVNYIFTVIAFFGLALISRLVIWAPLESVAGVFGLLVSPQFWVSLFIVSGLFASAINYFTTNYVFCASNESFTSADRPELPAAFLIFLLGSSFMLCSISFLTGIVTSWMQSSTAFVFAFLSIFVAAAKISAENDFRLYYLGDAVPSTSLKTLLRFAYKTVQKDAFEYLVRTAVTLRYSCGATFILSILSSSLRSYIFVLFDPILIAQIAAIVGAIFVLSDLLCLITNIVTMDKVEFVLPTPYFFSDARPDVVNLVNALNSDDLLLRLFAFHDFYTKARSENRAVFFTLSQPGNHPRLWDSVFFSCQKAIQHVSDTFMKETENVLIKNSAGLRHVPFLNNDRSTVKSSLLVPPTLKPKTAIQTRKPLFDFAPLTSKIRPFVEATKNHFIAPKPFAPSVDTDIAAFAVEGLGSLVEASYTQDRFGIVQKRLPQIVETLLDLGVACDQLIRAKAMRQQTTVYAEQRVFMIRASAIAALTDIYTAFQSHIYDLSLTPNQLTQLNEYANPKHL